MYSYLLSPAVIVNDSLMLRITTCNPQLKDLQRLQNIKPGDEKCAGLSELFTEHQADLHAVLQVPRSSYHTCTFPVVDLQVAHGFNDGHYGLDGVAVNHGSVLLTLVF